MTFFDFLKALQIQLNMRYNHMVFMSRAPVQTHSTLQNIYRITEKFKVETSSFLINIGKICLPHDGLWWSEMAALNCEYAI